MTRLGQNTFGNDVDTFQLITLCISGAQHGQSQKVGEGNFFSASVMMWFVVLDSKEVGWVALFIDLWLYRGRGKNA